MHVAVRRLDEELHRLGIVHVDFIKLDVEGAELGVLQGAAALFSGPSRPAILAEVQDLRTHPWGYAAREILRFMVRKDYRWFALDAEGNLFPVSTRRTVRCQPCRAASGTGAGIHCNVERRHLPRPGIAYDDEPAVVGGYAA